jgi:hypothetical protein
MRIYILGASWLGARRFLDRFISLVLAEAFVGELHVEPTGAEHTL